MRERAADIADIRPLPRSPWIAPLLNSWVNYGSGYETAGYFRDSSGVVHLRGFIANGTSGAVAFTLPPGYRPAATAKYPIPTWAGSGTGLGNVDVTANGAVVINTASVTFLSISGITFLAEN